MKRLAISSVFTVAALAVAAAPGLGCGPGSKGGPTLNSKIGGDELPPPPASPVVSQDILAREPVANTAEVKHILIGWKEMAEAYGGRLDPRAAQRDKAAAEAEVKSLLEQLQGGADFDAMMKEHSEDVGSAGTSRAYTVTPDAQLVIEFRQLALRLKAGEIGVCQSEFGFHIIKRLQ